MARKSWIGRWVVLGVVLFARSAAADALTLPAALAEARKNAPDIEVARARTKVAQAAFVAANKWVVTNPTLSLGYSTGAPFGDEDRVYSLGISMPIEIGGQQGLRHQIATAQSQEALADEARARNELLGEVAVAFFGLDSARRAIAVESEIVTTYDELLAITRTSLEKGVGTKLDVLTLELEVGRLRADLAATKALAGSTETQLCALLGRKPTTIEPVTESIPTVAALDVEGLVAKAMEARPEIAAARARLRVFRSEVTLAKREAWLTPTVGVGVQHERMAFGLDGFRLTPEGVPGLLGIDEHRTSLTLNLSIPLPFFNANSGPVAKSSAGAELASAEENAAKVKVEAEVRAAVAIVKGAAEAFQTHEKLRPTTLEAAAAYREAFEKRQVGLAEMLLGHERILRVRLQYLTARSNYLRARALLDRAVGAWSDG